MYRRMRGRESYGGEVPSSSSVAMAIDKNKSTQYAMKWAVKNVVAKDQILKLVHVRETSIVPRNGSLADIQHSEEELFLTYRCFCRRKRMDFETCVIEDEGVAKALIKYVFRERIEILVLGSEQRNGIYRLFRGRDIPGNVLKNAPDFCTVYVISSKGKMHAVKKATRKLPKLESPSRIIGKWEYDEISEVEMENSRPESAGCSSTDSNFQSFYENLEDQVLSPMATTTDHSTLNGSVPFFDSAIITAYANNPITMDKYEEEAVESLKEELKQTLEMYHQALKEAKQKVAEVEEWRRKEEKRIEEMGEAEEEEKRNVRNVKKLIVEIHRLKQEIVNTEKTALDALAQSNRLLRYQTFFHTLLLLLFFAFFVFYF